MTSSSLFRSTPPLSLANPNPRFLPASFLNRDGKPEFSGLPTLTAVHEDENRPLGLVRGDQPSVLRPLSESDALERLRHALVETGQLFVTAEDGLSRIGFAGIGDSDNLFVEVLPRDHQPDDLEPEDEIAGAICSLAQAEIILRQVYAGETTSRVSNHINRLRRRGVQEIAAA